MNKEPVILILDVGKTNKKVLLFSFFKPNESKELADIARFIPNKKAISRVSL